MFTYRKFDVDLARELSADGLAWPEPGAAADDSGLGCNRLYADLRRLSWSEARRVYELETKLIARVEAAENPAEEWTFIEDELYEEPDEHLYGLDLGVASSVVALSATRCVPFSSCNAGAFRGHHYEIYPLVAFFARPLMVDVLLLCAREANTGLEVGERGCVVAYADDIRAFRSFAMALTAHRAAFRALRNPRSVKTAPQPPGHRQLSLFP
jgi:hypothetical protein